MVDSSEQAMTGDEGTPEEEFLYLLSEGSDLLGAGRIREAVEQFEHALSLRPGHEQAENLLGLTRVFARRISGENEERIDATELSEGEVIRDLVRRAVKVVFDEHIPLEGMASGTGEGYAQVRVGTLREQLGDQDGARRAYARAAEIFADADEGHPYAGRAREGLSRLGG